MRMNHQPGEFHPTRRPALSWVLAVCVLGLGLAALACSQEPASDSEGPFISQVDSAPPTAGLGATAPGQSRKTSLETTWDRKAREAFDRWAPLLASGATEQARALVGIQPAQRFVFAFEEGAAAVIQQQVTHIGRSGLGGQPLGTGANP